MPTRTMARDRTARLTAAGPGVLAALSVAALATVLGRWVPVVGAPALAIVGGFAGAATASIRRPGPAATPAPGLAWASRQALQGSVVVLGFGLSLGQVASIGVGSLPVLVGTLAAALAVAKAVGRRLGLSRDVTVLVGAGTAICGASAIAAVDSVIDADETDVSYAVTTIFLFNVAAVLLYPSVGHLLGLSQHSFGLFAGTAINDTSSVVAASTLYGHQALGYAVVVKLTRTLAIVPVCAVLGRSARRAAGPGPGPRPRHVVPYFLLTFLLAAAVNSSGLIPAALHRDLATLATAMITVALAAIGLSTRVDHIRRAGPRPVALGAVVWVAVGVASLALQGVFGLA